ncbi:MAG: dipeptidase [Phycisphaerales bacterium]
MPWFDAHLDLAMLAELGRDMEQDPSACGGPELPAAVTFPSLAEGGVTHCLGTIFTEADGKPSEPHAYPAGDAEAANQAGLRQLKRYQDWDRPHHYRRLAAASGEQPPPPDPRLSPNLLVLVEGADPILEPADLGEWRERGVVAIGMAWWKPSRYAGGNGTDLGLTDLGRALALEMDRLGVVHDASHLSDRAFWELSDRTDRPIIASHSNCRSLVGGGSRGENQRHLHDDQIREIVRRDGVIGINLFSRFLRPAADTDAPTRATIDDCVRHIEHVCRLAGDRAHVGLGSDMDGGFSAARLPEGIDRPRDLERLAQALVLKGWTGAEVEGFRFTNWARFWGVGR